MRFFHKPVMLHEAVNSLNCKQGGIYVDGTVGGGGHASEILERISPDGKLIAIDNDKDALNAAAERLSCFGDRAILIHDNFVDISNILARLNIEKVDGILLDLGVSSHQLDIAERGFCFTLNGPLDMRMNQESGKSAADLVNSLSGDELKMIIRDYGEEKMAGRIVRAILKQRETAPLRTTAELAALVTRALPSHEKRRKTHPATKTFQAIRIAVNDELDNLQTAINSGIGLLAQGGRFSIISFHSLEDRIVKNAFRYGEKECICPHDLPVCACEKKQTLRLITKKAIIPGMEEITDNPRARSARLRTAERI